MTIHVILDVRCCSNRHQSLFREGYFWLSNYDATIQTPATFTGTLVEDGNYDHLYMNDYVGFANAPDVEIRKGAFDRDRDEDGVIQRDEIVKCANVFEAKDNEMLRSVGALANRANSLIEYWVYLLKEGFSDPEDGELIYSAEGENGIKAKYAGYNVQDLLTPIALVKGQLFSVVARIFGSEGGQLPLEVESEMSEYPYVKVARGQTYYLCRADSWNLPQRLGVLLGIVAVFLFFQMWIYSDFGGLDALISNVVKRHRSVIGATLTIFPLALYNRKVGYNSKWFGWLYSCFYPLQFAAFALIMCLS